MGHFESFLMQVFSVRSGGATGIVVKSPGNFGAKTLVLPEDKGSLISIALSPDQKVILISSPILMFIFCFQGFFEIYLKIY